MDKKQEVILVCHALDSGYDAYDIASTRETSWSRMTSLSPFLIKFFLQINEGMFVGIITRIIIYKMITTRIPLNNGLKQ